MAARAHCSAAMTTRADSRAHSDSPAWWPGLPTSSRSAATTRPRPARVRSTSWCSPPARPMTTAPARSHCRAEVRSASSATRRPRSRAESSLPAVARWLPMTSGTAGPRGRAATGSSRSATRRATTLASPCTAPAAAPRSPATTTAPVAHSRLCSTPPD